MPDLSALTLALSSLILGGVIVAQMILMERRDKHWREILAARSLSEYANAQRLMARPVAVNAPARPGSNYLDVFDAPPGPSEGLKNGS